MMHRRIPSAMLAAVLLLAAMSAVVPAAAAQEDDAPTVRGVLFFSPTCGHCEYVINSVMPPLYLDNGGPWEVFFDEELEEEGVPFYLLDNGTLQFLVVDVSVEAGSRLFREATDAFDVDNNGVPRMIVADEVYIGSADIPEALPELISEGLEAGGIDWPDLAGMEEAVASIPVPDVTTTTTTSPEETSTTGGGEEPTTTTEATTTTGGGSVLPPSGGDSIGDRFGRDPVGNTFSVIVLAGMLAALAGVVALWRRPGGRRKPGIAVPIIAVAGIAVAAYLSYVETSGAEAVCGPVGDCNTVQQSEYAELFGVIPIGLLGLIGYLIVLGTWLVARTDHNPISDVARITLFAGTLGGVVLSLYLTFLEPFVIGATCAWCLTSAVVITALMLLAAGPAADSWSKLRAEV